MKLQLLHFNTELQKKFSKQSRFFIILHQSWRYKKRILLLKILIKENLLLKIYF
jgi:hypothetical protein